MLQIILKHLGVSESLRVRVLTVVDSVILLVFIKSCYLASSDLWGSGGMERSVKFRVTPEIRHPRVNHLTQYRIMNHGDST